MPASTRGERPDPIHRARAPYVATIASDVVPVIAYDAEISMVQPCDSATRASRTHAASGARLPRSGGRPASRATNWMPVVPIISAAITACFIVDGRTHSIRRRSMPAASPSCGSNPSPRSMKAAASPSAVAAARAAMMME